MWDRTQHITVSCVGDYHLRQRPPIPNQDAAVTEITPRPFAVLADGAGSAKLSHVAANETVHGLASLICGLEPISSELLDREESPRGDLAEKYRYAFWAFLKDRLRRLSFAYGHEGSLDHFKTTLSVLVIGKHSSFFIKRGDSPIVVFFGGAARRIGVEDSGAWAGQVAFFSSAVTHDDLQWGLIKSDFSEAMLCSDGFADLTVHRVTNEINPFVTELLSEVRAGKQVTARLMEQLSRQEIASTFSDDKTVALICLPLSKAAVAESHPSNTKIPLAADTPYEQPRSQEPYSVHNPTAPPSSPARFDDSSSDRTRSRKRRK
jgi:serine/threonine protein phosphatase PrpC